MRIRKHVFSGGAHTPHRKNTALCETVAFTTPSVVLLPMQQHIGAPCQPVVKTGEQVKVGQLVADSEQAFSAPIYASVSGTVGKIRKIEMPSGQQVEAIEIIPDGLMEADEHIAPPEVNSKEDFVQAVRRSGLVGLGGAGFPTHIKLNPKTHIDTLIVNAAECEPYITSDYRACVENPEDILAGIRAVRKYLNIEHAVIAIENNKKDAAKLLQNMAKNSSDPLDDVQVKLLPARYPQGAEKVIVNAVTGRVIEAGKLPSDVGVLVMNVTSIAFIAGYLRTGMPLTRKRITVDGGAIANPANVWVPIGTPIREIIEFLGGYRDKAEKLIMGGPMMGVALCGDEFPLLKQNNAILALTDKEVYTGGDSVCIRCGKCVAHCPMSLSPCLIARAAKSQDVEQLTKLNVMSCIECGTCSFSCPAGKFLVQSARMGKAIVKAKK